MIAASFRSEYGVSLYSEEFKKMKWTEFASLLSGIGADSPLGRLIQIRLEDDREVLKNFTSSQRRIRSKWQSKKAKTVTQKECDSFLDDMKKFFVSM